MTNKICIVGWHFSKKIYDQLAISNFDIHIVAHKYNKILDDLPLNYTVIKNVGRESHAYDWYIKNIWDGKNGVLFMHDDIEVKDFKKTFKNILEQMEGKDLSYVLGRTDEKRKANSERCFFLSKKLIKLILKEYGGIWYDIHNKGYTFGNFKTYDPETYTDNYIQNVLLKKGNFTENINKIIKKYSLVYKNIISKEIFLCRRGGILNKKIEKHLLNDNSIFGREENKLEDIIKYKKHTTDKGRAKHYYTKWYNFYFKGIKNENLNILEIGAADGNSITMWKKYFKNSEIYGIEKDKNLPTSDLINKFKIFIGDQSDTKFLEKVCSEVPEGFDIIIDDGSHITSDQVVSFEFLFDKLNPGGIYIIEDLFYSYLESHKIGECKSSVDFLKNKIDDINYNGKFLCGNFEVLVKKSKFLERYERIIDGMSFHAGICFIFKRFCR